MASMGKPPMLSAFDMASAKGKHHAGIDEDVVIILNCFLKEFGGKAAHRRQVTMHHRAFDVQLIHP